jgi:hypothetical protein
MLFVLFAIISNPSNGKSSLNTKIKIALGTSLPFITVSLLYGVSGKLLELWKGMYLLPKYLFQSVNLLDFQVGITSTLLICGSIIPLLYTLIIPGSLFSQEERAHIQKVLILHICVILGVFISRPMYGHHLLQLTFLPLISFGVCLKNQLNQQHFLRRFLIVNRKAITFSLFLILGMFVFRNLAASDQLDAKFQASNNLVKEVSNVSTRVGAQTVWSPNASYIYYRLDLKPSSPITVHPVGLVTTAIRKAYLGANSNFTITFKKVIDSEPDVVVLNRHETYFSDSELNRIENWLKRKYSLVRTCPSGFQIYKVKSE